MVAACLPDPAALGDRMHGKTCAGLWVTGTGKDGRPRSTYLYHVVDNDWTMSEYGHQCVVWQTAVNPVVALELLSTKPMGIGVGHGWIPASKPLRVTAVEGTRVVSLNGLPAVEAFEAHASETAQEFHREAPLGFFLHNILGIDTDVVNPNAGLMWRPLPRTSVVESSDVVVGLVSCSGPTVGSSARATRSKPF